MPSSLMLSSGVSSYSAVIADSDIDTGHAGDASAAIDSGTSDAPGGDGETRANAETDSDSDGQPAAASLLDILTSGDTLRGAARKRRPAAASSSASEKWRPASNPPERRAPKPIDLGIPKGQFAALRAVLSDKIPMATPVGREEDEIKTKNAKREAERKAEREEQARRDEEEALRRAKAAEDALKAKSEPPSASAPPPPAPAPPPPAFGLAPSAPPVIGMLAEHAAIPPVQCACSAQCESPSPPRSVVTRGTQTEPLPAAACDIRTEPRSVATCDTQTEPRSVAACETQTEPIQTATCETQTEPPPGIAGKTRTEAPEVASQSVQTSGDPVSDLLFRNRTSQAGIDTPPAVAPQRVAPRARETAALVMGSAASLAAVAVPGMAIAELLLLPPAAVLLLALTALALGVRLLQAFNASARARAQDLREQRRQWARAVQAFASDASDARLWAWMTKPKENVDTDVARADFAAFEREFRQKCREFMVFARVGLVHADAFERGGHDVRAVLDRLRLQLRA